MTFTERVQALEPLGLTPRQTRFVVTLALHGGYCLRRHYATFAGLRYGRHVREFLDGLVARRLARRTQYRADRGYLYHLHAKAVYRAIDQPENRNRRTASPALIAQRLMLLDHVLREPADEWFATEADKVALFTERFHVPHADLPQRTYGPPDGSTRTTRYFIHKLPIAVLGDPPLVQLVCLITQSGGRGCAAFLRDHRCLLRHLPAWTLAAVGPAHVTSLSACQTIFDAFVTAMRCSGPVADADELRWYFVARRAVEQQQLGALSVADLDRVRAARRRFASPPYESLYAGWRARGDGVCSTSLPSPQETPRRDAAAWCFARCRTPMVSSVPWQVWCDGPPCAATSVRGGPHLAPAVSRHPGAPHTFAVGRGTHVHHGCDRADWSQSASRISTGGGAVCRPRDAHETRDEGGATPRMVRSPDPTPDGTGQA